MTPCNNAFGRDKMTVEQDKAASDAKRIEEMNKLPPEDRTAVIATSPSVSEKTIAPGISALKALNQDLDPVMVNKKAALDEALQKEGIVGNAGQLIAEYGTPEAAMKAVKDSPKTRSGLKTASAVVSKDTTDSAERDEDNAAPSTQKTKDKKEKDEEDIEATNVAATAVVANEIASSPAGNALTGYAGNNPPLGNLKNADVSPGTSLGKAGASIMEKIFRSPAPKADVLES